MIFSGPTEEVISKLNGNDAERIISLIVGFISPLQLSLSNAALQRLANETNDKGRSSASPLPALVALRCWKDHEPPTPLPLPSNFKSFPTISTRSVPIQDSVSR